MESDTQTVDKCDGGSPAQASSLSDTKRYFASNTASQAALFVFNAATSIYMVRYVIHTLGMANYGMVTLANQVVAWAFPAAAVIVGSLGRFILLHLARGEEDTARSYFSTQFLAVAAAFAFLLPITAVVSYLAPVLFNVPQGFEQQTRYVFFLTYLAFLFWLFTLTLQVSTYVTQRFYIRNMIEILNQAVRYAAWIALFAVTVPALWQIGVGYALGALAAAVVNFFVFRKLTPYLWSKRPAFDRARFSEVAKLGSWVSIGQIGGILYFSCDAVVINRMLGPENVGNYGTIAGLAMMARMVSGNLAGFIGPAVVTRFAQNDLAGMARIVTRSIKFVSLLFAIALGIACGLSKPFLEWWIGPQFGWLSVLMWFMFSHMVFNLGMDPVASVTTATNRFAPQSIATVCGGVLKVVLSVAVLKWTSWGLIGVVIADLICWTARNTVFLPVYVGRLLKTPALGFHKSLIPALLVFPAAALTSLWVAGRFHLAGFLNLFLVGICLLAVFAGAAFVLALDAEDKRFLRDVSPFGKARSAA